ncbi:MAG TPA: DUF4388 domain-containing protein [Pyrinomonadaceae bacterium]|jgi:hypothetical protein|nr:DUF4388 domain-containing protein [Pyrinomonadaceae bacterium]
MQNNRFVVLTGHLSNYPLSDLIGILRHQKKSGRLLIEYPKGPATFFFQNGELIDARMNDLIGLQAICVALAQPEASFNFNPLIQSPRRSIEPSLQRAVSELFGCWDESAMQIESTAATPSLESPPATAVSSRSLTGRRSELLALPPGPSISIQRRSLVLAGAAVVMVVGLSTVIAVTGGFKNNQPENTSIQQPQTPVAPAAAPAELPSSQASLAAAVVKPKRQNKQEEKSSTQTVAETQATETVKEAEPTAQPIKVVMQIENGRVLKASIANPKPGMDGYEAMALRIARQRRYPANTTGGETITINVSR